MAERSTGSDGIAPAVPELDAPDERRQSIEHFIRDVVDTAGADGVVVNLSGGIDSAVTASLAVEALGSNRVTGLVLPAEPTTQSDVDDAILLAELLVIDYRVIDVQPIVDRFVASFAQGLETGRTDTGPDVAESADREAIGNVAARLRMTAAYYAANRLNRLVLGTGNRTELELGYFTKYGDGGVDALPIGDCYKTQVRDLARVLNVPERIIDKPPSAGLWEGQTDEGELGAPYPVIDAIIHERVDKQRSNEAIAADLDVEKSIVGQITARVERSAHKRRMPPTPSDW